MERESTCLNLSEVNSAIFSGTLSVEGGYYTIEDQPDAPNLLHTVCDLNSH